MLSDPPLGNSIWTGDAVKETGINFGSAISASVDFAPYSRTASGTLLQSLHPSIKGRTGNTFCDAKFVHAQTARLTIRKTLLPVEIIIESDGLPGLPITCLLNA